MIRSFFIIGTAYTYQMIDLEEKYLINFTVFYLEQVLHQLVHQVRVLIHRLPVYSVVILVIHRNKNHRHFQLVLSERSFFFI
jgi:hypothetical protein